MNLKLSVLERMVLLRVMPQQGDVTTLRIVRDLERELSFTEEEHAALEFYTEENAVRWKQDAVQEKDVEFGPKASSIVLAGLGELDKRKALRMEYLSLCDKFGYEPPEDDQAE